MKMAAFPFGIKLIPINGKMAFRHKHAAELGIISQAIILNRAILSNIAEIEENIPSAHFSRFIMRKALSYWNIKEPISVLLSLQANRILLNPFSVNCLEHIVGLRLFKSFYFISANRYNKCFRNMNRTRG